MSEPFNTRFTHALLISIIVILTRDPTNEHLLLRMILPFWYITAAFAWAYFLPKWRAYVDRKDRERATPESPT